MLLPALSKVKDKAKLIQCLNNEKQLTLGWIMHADDNSDTLLIARQDPPNGEAWINGFLNYNSENRSNWDPKQDIEKSPVWNYSGKTLKIWRCPGDKSTIEVGSRKLPRVRSYSMNEFIGSPPLIVSKGTRVPAVDFQVYRKLSTFNDPGPSSTFVLLDMREDSINAGGFGVNMAGFPETKRWLDPRTKPPIEKGKWMDLNDENTPNNPDIRWLQEKATRHRLRN